MNCKVYKTPKCKSGKCSTKKSKMTEKKAKKNAY